MEARSGRLAGELAQLLDKLLLELIVQAVLLAEVDDAALGDCRPSSARGGKGGVGQHRQGWTDL